VLTDGAKVAFVSNCDVRDTLLKWQEIKGKEIKLIHYNRYGDNVEITFQLYNPNHFVGVKATRFIDLRGAREETKAVQFEESDYDSVFARKLSISKKVDCDSWFHINSVANTSLKVRPQSG
jgi:hypothetical protein